MLVKVGASGGIVNEVALEDNQTVSDALRVAGISVGDREVRVNGAAASLDTIIEDGDIVLLTTKIKGA